MCTLEMHLIIIELQTAALTRRISARPHFVNHINTIYYKEQQSILIIKKYNSYIWDSEYYDILNKCFSLLRFETAVVFLEPTNEARRTLLTPDILERASAGAGRNA